MAVIASRQAVEARAAMAVEALYEELDIPMPTVSMPIAPLGPMLDYLKLAHEALPGLTARKAEAYLQNRGVVDVDGLGLTGDLTERLAGFIYASGRVARLFVNADDPVVRRRFSIAHELGHYVMHFRPQFAHWREALAADQALPAALYDAFTLPEDEEQQSDNSFDQQEREADAFAATLLMPWNVVRQRADALRADYPGTALVDRLCSEMMVSRAAMRIRLHGLVSAPGEPGEKGE